jgi:hypothetical protein
MNLVLDLEKKHFPTLNALNLGLLLLAVLHVKGRHALELEFLSHGPDTAAERCLLSVIRKWVNGSERSIWEGEKASEQHQVEN